MKGSVYLKSVVLICVMWCGICGLTHLKCLHLQAAFLLNFPQSSQCFLLRLSIPSCGILSHSQLCIQIGWRNLKKYWSLTPPQRCWFNYHLGIKIHMALQVILMYSHVWKNPCSNQVLANMIKVANPVFNCWNKVWLEYRNVHSFIYLQLVLGTMANLSTCDRDLSAPQT